MVNFKIRLKENGVKRSKKNNKKETSKKVKSTQNHIKFVIMLIDKMKSFTQCILRSPSWLRSLVAFRGKAEGVQAILAWGEANSGNWGGRGETRVLTTTGPRGDKRKIGSRDRGGGRANSLEDL